MTVTCKVTQCPYYDNRGFCAKPSVVVIDEQGMCSVIWKKGQPRPLFMPIEDFYEQHPIIIDEIAETQVHDLTETNDKEVVESRSEDPQNGAAATI